MGNPHPTHVGHDCTALCAARGENRLLTGLLPITESDEQDMFLAGFPTSGSTWMENLGASARCGIDPELRPDSIIQESVPDVVYKRYYKRFSTPMVFAFPASHS